MSSLLPLHLISRNLASGATTSVALTEAMLARASDPAGEGKRVFTLLDREGALAQARAFDLMRSAGIDLGPLMGIPVSVKDLFDIKGQVTRAGSVVLKGHAAAAEDAEIVQRLRRAGAVIIGRTNMVEFAYSGIGLNPHYGTPKNPWDRATGRVPGGSSSGAGVSIVDQMAAASIGTDTGGSVRIPAALVGVVGFKPTANRVPQRGTLPLSSSLDSIGPLAPTVRCCATIDAIMAGTNDHALAPIDVKQVRLLAPSNRLLDDLDDAVASAFDAGLARLSAAGVTIVSKVVAPIEELYGSINPFASFSPPEAFAWHRTLLSLYADQYDQRVASRIQKGALLSAADYIELGLRRRMFMADMNKVMEGFDALVMPTVAVVAPPIAPLESDDALYWKTNALVLRNTSAINFLDGCALSIPVHQPGEAPVGLSLAQCGGADSALLALGAALEHVINPAPMR
jgi:aspartyl-tRNA(Asn)/glutamyl-tRNA(Gln) amidotransferase subunit A